MPKGHLEQIEKLLLLARKAVEQDMQLREQYQIGHKFRFIHDRLKALLARVEENASSLKAEIAKDVKRIAEDETPVYVHLFNAQGAQIQKWQKFLLPTVFREYSVNRPIYTEKSQIEAFIKSRPNQMQHGYLTIVVKKANILMSQSPLKDALDQPLIKVKEDSLRFEKLLSFTHNNHHYGVTKTGELMPKEE